MEELCKSVPCRENEIKELFALIGERNEPLPFSIFISGTTATGKSLCVKSILQCLDYKHAIVNCKECYDSPQILYKRILTGLKYNEDIECESMRCLKNELNKLAKEYDNVHEPVVVVFEGAERLRDMKSMFSALLKLREDCHLNICTIFISQIAYEGFYFQMGVPEPIEICFSNYDKEELFKIIFLEQKNFIEDVLANIEVEEDIKIEINKPELFAIFLNAFLSVFYPVCQDLRELKRMARVNFIAFCKPIVLYKINATNLNKLWKHISPILKTSLDMLYERDSSIEENRGNKEICETNTGYELPPIIVRNICQECHNIS